MSAPHPSHAFPGSLLLFSIATSGAPVAGDIQAPSPWQGIGIDLGFLEETLENDRCSRSDQPFLSCVGAVLRERDLFPTALPREPEVWAHPDAARLSAIRRGTEDSGLAAHRVARAAAGSRDADSALVVGQDALMCLLTLRL